MKFEDLLKKTYYIVDCMDFIYYPRIVFITGVSVESGAEPLYYLNIKDLFNKPRTMYMEELEKFKTYEEALKEAKRLNNILSNKKIAKLWNSPKRLAATSFLKSSRYFKVEGNKE